MYYKEKTTLPVIIYSPSNPLIVRVQVLLGFWRIYRLNYLAMQLVRAQRYLVGVRHGSCESERQYVLFEHSVTGFLLRNWRGYYQHA